MNTMLKVLFLIALMLAVAGFAVGQTQSVPAATPVASQTATTAAQVQNAAAGTTVPSQTEYEKPQQAFPDWCGHDYYRVELLKGIGPWEGMMHYISDENGQIPHDVNPFKFTFLKRTEDESTRIKPSEQLSLPEGYYYVRKDIAKVDWTAFAEFNAFWQQRLTQLAARKNHPAATTVTKNEKHNPTDTVRSNANSKSLTTAAKATKPATATTTATAQTVTATKNVAATAINQKPAAKPATRTNPAANTESAKTLAAKVVIPAPKPVNPAPAAPKVTTSAAGPSPAPVPSSVKEAATPIKAESKKTAAPDAEPAEAKPDDGQVAKPADAPPQWQPGDRRLPGNMWQKAGGGDFYCDAMYDLDRVNNKCRLAQAISTGASAASTGGSAGKKKTSIAAAIIIWSLVVICFGAACAVYAQIRFFKKAWRPPAKRSGNQLPMTPAVGPEAPKRLPEQVKKAALADYDRAVGNKSPQGLSPTDIRELAGKYRGQKTANGG